MLATAWMPLPPPAEVMTLIPSVPLALTVTPVPPAVTVRPVPLAEAALTPAPDEVLLPEMTGPATAPESVTGGVRLFTGAAAQAAEPLPIALRNWFAPQLCTVAS